MVGCRRRYRRLARVMAGVLALQTLAPAGAGTAAIPAGRQPAGPFRMVVQRSVAPGEPITLAGLRHDRIYSVTIAVDPVGIGDTKLQSAVRDARVTLAEKILHLGDPDLYALIRPTTDGDGSVVLTSTPNAQHPTPSASVRLIEWNAPADSLRSVAYGPAGDWQHATPMELGTPVFGSGDLTPYVPTEVPETTRYYDAVKQAAQLTAERRTAPGEQWLTFHYEGPKKLVYFTLDLPDRDAIPPDVSLFTAKQGALTPYEDGADPVSPPHEIQALPGNKLITRIISPGVYFVRVIANHPEWTLRTQVLDPPPYADPRQAVRSAMDYLLAAGDSWHANTPRAGGRLDRVGSVHAETAQCIACHPTQFTTRAVLTAVQNGYRFQRRESMRFLIERLANNPRPLYGHPEANWARMISAPANVIGRSADLVGTAHELLGEPERADVSTGACNYLKLYFKGRTELPPEESNGNQPLVSPYAVLYHAWRVFAREYKRTGDITLKPSVDQMLTLAAQPRPNADVRDVAWQLICLAKMDRQRFAKEIEADCQRLLAAQREDGQWSMLFDPKAASVEFQTGHCLYALACAGYTADHPAIKKGVEYLLKRQQPWGGWFDPLQSYENFRTPFRETQFAVMALSELYKEASLGRGQHAATQPESPASALNSLDTIWDGSEVEALWQLNSPEPMVRRLAAEALGRVGDASAAKPLAVALGDESKMVQRAAAAALRALASRGIGIAELRAAMRDPSARTRWGAARVFAWHSRALVPARGLADDLLRLADDPSAAVRMSALQSLWQWYWWTADTRVRGRMLDCFLARLAVPEHPWVARAAREGIYNAADENVRYLYGNWIPAMQDSADREQAAAAQRAEDELVAGKLAAAIQSGNPRLRAETLRAITEFHLRNVRSSGTKYNRIGNDIETIRFLDHAADLMEPAIRSALADPAPEVRCSAILASLTIAGSGARPVAAELVRALGDAVPAVRAAAQECYKAVPLELGPKAAEAVAALLRADSPEGRVAGLGLALGLSALARDRDVNTALERLFASTAPADRRIVMEAARGSALVRRDLRVVGAVSDALLGKDESLRDAALEVAGVDRAVVGAASVRAALGELARDGNRLAAELIDAKGGRTEPTSPDYAYFAREVMPQFARKSAQDGNACVSCHFNHTLFRVTAPDASGQFTEAQIREAYRASLKVIDLRRPEQSLLLRKPSSSSASEGQVGVTTLAHGGGLRWSGPDDPAYRAVLAWINGAR